MKTYYIQERHMEMTYIELRLLLYTDCKLKLDKITEILNFLNYNGFIAHLLMFSPEISAEKIQEHQDVMSLTIDVKNDKLRFKFWNGATTIWVFHTRDLFNALHEGREEFLILYNKYKIITDILLKFKEKWSVCIYDISYQYYPEPNIDLVYNIVFLEEVKKSNYTAKILYKINKEIIALGEDVTKDLNFYIEYSYKELGCSPCEKAKKERKNNDELNG